MFANRNALTVIRSPTSLRTSSEAKATMVSLAKSSSLSALSILPTIASAFVRDAAIQEFVRGAADTGRGAGNKATFWSVTGELTFSR
jgi:hypothetical protein